MVRPLLFRGRVVRGFGSRAGAGPERAMIIAARISASRGVIAISLPILVACAGIE